MRGNKKSDKKMMISERQIAQLIDIAYKFSIILHSQDNHTTANKLEDFLETIANQQSEELKEIK